MNHTIKGILVVAAITSMLVVGATMVPVMQNAFAGKKHDFKKQHDFKKARSSSVTNTNDNDLSAILNSTNTAANSNTITNTNTQNQSQGQNACILVGECTAASTETEGD